jgi:hypothetical protein
MEPRRCLDDQAARVRLTSQQVLATPQRAADGRQESRVPRRSGGCSDVRTAVAATLASTSCQTVVL